MKNTLTLTLLSFLLSKLDSFTENENLKLLLENCAIQNVRRNRESLKNFLKGKINEKYIDKTLNELEEINDKIQEKFEKRLKKRYRSLSETAFQFLCRKLKDDKIEADDYKMAGVILHDKWIAGKNDCLKSINKIIDKKIDKIYELIMKNLNSDHTEI